MCGISGITGNQEDAWIESMNHVMAHRGPDGMGVFRDAQISLGQQRLAIIDLDGGRQPMQSVCGRYVLVYNGEIYNARELRKELEASGERFETDHSDTEVLLHLLIREGEAALERLNGMFAFALFDREKRSLFCARDRTGIKPFYFIRQGGRFAFASELKALLNLPWVSREPDLQSLFHYFSLQYIPGEATAISGVDRLAPGTWLRYDLETKSLDQGQWWQPSFPATERRKGEELTEQLTQVLGDAVDRWAIADVPIGCLLSGGLDSTAVVGLLAQRGHQLKTYTVGFTGEGEQEWDELHLAGQLASKWGTEHQEIILDPSQLLGDLADMVWSLDEPYGGGLPSWSVFKAMGADVKVAMTGTGGDELFGNYNKFVLMEGRYRGRMGLGRRSVGRKRFEQSWFRHYAYASDADKRSRMLTPAFGNVSASADFMWQQFSRGGQGEVLRDRVARLDFATQLPEEFLQMTDRFSMAHSIEARTPLLDPELIDLTFSIPASHRLTPWSYKHLLRGVVKDLLPPDLMDAPKRGFVIPMKLWLRDRLRPMQARLLDPGRLAVQGIVQSDFHARYAQPHIEGRADNTNRLWSMLMFQLWWDMFIEQRPRDELRALILGESI